MSNHDNDVCQKKPEDKDQGSKYMSLRDYIAMQVMLKMLDSKEICLGSDLVLKPGQGQCSYIAVLAYMMADEMMKARKEESDPNDHL